MHPDSKGAVPDVYSALLSILLPPLEHRVHEGLLQGGQGASRLVLETDHQIWLLQPGQQKTQVCLGGTMG